MDSGTNIIISMLIGTIGFGYFIYGRKQMKGSALVAGIILCIYPYFLSNLWIMLLVGAGIMTAPFFIHD
jgi:hypothetical protein